MSDSPLAAPEDYAAWPDWADTCRLDDTLAAAAYETVPATCRAALKTGLALACMHFGESDLSCAGETRSHHLGFWRAWSSGPVPWALVFFSSCYAAAARLAAACVPAVLAGVPGVAAVCVGGRPSPPALVSLELTGVEDIFLMNSRQASALLAETARSPGRVLLLHEGELAGLADKARALRLPCWEEARMPVLAIPHPQAFDLDALAFAQGTACAVARGDSQGSPAPDALYLPPGAARQACRNAAHEPPAPLLLTPGCEGFWLHPGLTPQFFRSQCLAFGGL